MRPLEDKVDLAQWLLALGMLRQVAYDMAQGDRKAKAWLYQTDDFGCVTFEACCETLGLRHRIVRDTMERDPGKVADQLSKLLEARAKRPSREDNQ